ncbi:MAG: transglycosylase domain-containing protein [Bacteroidales bacterium]|nr:transglycosylase domain-containing protein [Bacteroidales bacterium]
MNLNCLDHKKIIRLGIIAFAAIPVILLLFVFIRARCLMESKNELRNVKNANASIVLSHNGRLIGKIFKENRTGVTREQIPGHLVQALVATEDARFYKHKGVDTRSLFRVFFKTFLLNRKNAGGGSTITQQLAKNLFGRNIRGPFALLTAKLKEIMLARKIERLFTKEEILTLYFNTVPFGENVYGIETAAQRYFNTKTENLKIEQGAVLVGMLKANHTYNPRLFPEKALSRRNVVLSQMRKYEYLPDSQLDSLSKLPLKIDYANLEAAGPADYFLYQVKCEAQQLLQAIAYAGGKEWDLEEDGLVITTPLDLNLQQYANQAFRKHLSVMQYQLNRQYQTRWGRKVIDNLVTSELKKGRLTDKADETAIRQIFNWDGNGSGVMTVADSIRQMVKLLQAGLLAIDPRSGAVRAWVGGIDFKTLPYDQVLARRQMGSTLKPVLFAAALEMGYSPCTYLDNDSIVIKGYETWHPQNADHSTGGKYSLTGALVHSMNLPTINLFLETGFGRLDTLWREMGFSFQLVNTPSLALGTAEASVEEVAQAYAVFANGGSRIVPYRIVSIKDSRGNLIWQRNADDERVQILTAKTCTLISAMLRKAVQVGTGSALHSRYGVELPVAGKTGTTQDYTDAWFAAYCPSLVMVSRVGASLPTVHFNTGHYGTGSALALPLVAQTLKKVQANTVLARKLITPLPLPDQDMVMEMDCPDFREDTFMDDLLDMLREHEIDYEKAEKKAGRKRRPLFRRFWQ